MKSLSCSFVQFVRGGTISCAFFVLLQFSVSGYGDAENNLVQESSSSMTKSPSGLDVENLWLHANPISPETLDLWAEAVNNLGSEENRSCSYTKVTSPCDECDGDPTRRSIYALRHSLLRPGIKALMEWFDTPATHTVTAKVEEKYEPTFEPPWTLLRLDSEEPTERERYSHFQEKIALFSSVEQKRARRNTRISVGDLHPGAMRSWFIPLQPTHSLGSKDGIVFVGLQPNRKTKSPLTKHIQLTLAIDKLTKVITSFDQRSISSFVPHVGLRVQEVQFHGTLEREPQLDVVVLKHFEYSFHVRLTAVFPSKNRFTHWYRDFSCDNQKDEESEPSHTATQRL